MWTSRFELGVRFALSAAVLSAACDRPQLNDSASLDDAAERRDAEDSVAAGVEPDERATWARAAIKSARASCSTIEVLRLSSKTVSTRSGLPATTVTATIRKAAAK